jgi:uncharacterized OB-fold protein
MLKGMPLPVADLDTQPFWDGCREGRFLVPRCRACDRFRWPPGPMCPSCQATETDWIEASGRGTVYSWVVAAHPVHPSLVDQVPYVVGLVELEEGVRVVANVTGSTPAEVTAGMPVELYFEDLVEEVRLPNFRRAHASQQGRSR